MPLMPLRAGKEGRATVAAGDGNGDGEQPTATLLLLLLVLLRARRGRRRAPGRALQDRRGHAVRIASMHAARGQGRARARARLGGGDGGLSSQGERVGGSPKA
jgi:hypothetical protein